MAPTKKDKVVPQAEEQPIADETANQETGVVTSSQYPSWFIEKPNRRTGEIEMISKYRYMEGMPKEIRFDGRVGTYGPLGGNTTKSLVMRVIAFRFFQDDILGMGLKEWGEFFYIDEENMVCALLFHTHSLKNLREMAAPLFYQDLTLVDVEVKCTSVKMRNEKAGSDYFLAQFEATEAPIAEVDERLAFADTVRLYRRQTTTQHAVLQSSLNWFDMFAVSEPQMKDLPQDEEEGTSAEVDL